MTEDWGAVTSEELFERVGDIKPLKDLINEAAFAIHNATTLVENNNHTSTGSSSAASSTTSSENGTPTLNGREFGFVSEEPMHWWAQPNPNNKLLPHNYQPAEPLKRAPKILKTARKPAAGPRPTAAPENNTAAERLALQKRVTFDIEQFVSTDGLSLDEKRLVRLGGKPRKNRGINYKQLKAERSAAKQAATSSDTPKIITKLKKKQKEKPGRKKNRTA